MNAIAIIGFSFLLLFLEALTDAFAHRQKMSKKVIYGYLNHAAQPLTFMAYFVFGGAFLYWVMRLNDVSAFAALIQPMTLWMGLGYVMIRIGFFNWFFVWLADYKDDNGDALGTTSFIDVIAYGILTLIGKGMDWVFKLFGGTFNYRYLILLYNAGKILIAFLGCVIIARYGSYQ